MKSKTKKNFYDGINAGFSFVETLAVIAVMAVLASQVGIASYSMLQKAKVAAARTQIETIRVALQDFYIDNGRFPDADEGLEILWSNKTGIENWKGPYTEKPVFNDPWGNEYVYFDGTCLPDGAPEGLPYGVVSFGADGKEGGVSYESDIVSWSDE